jgi:hypothetical protein
LTYTTIWDSEMLMKTLHVCLAIVLVCIGSGFAHAADSVGAPQTKEQALSQYDAAKKTLSDELKAAKDKCDGISGGERKICKNDARTAYEQGEAKASAARDAALAAAVPAK